MAPTQNQKTVFHKVAEKIRKGTKVSVSKEMRESGLYSDSMSKKPDKLTRSKGWQQLMEKFLPDTLLTQRHKELLNSTRIDHLTFPLGPKDANDVDEISEEENEIESAFAPEHTTLTDKDITEMLAEVNCKVRKIVHGKTARHVYFWSADNKARGGALDMAYKLKGKYAPEKHLSIVAHLNPRKKKKIDEILGLTN